MFCTLLCYTLFSIISIRYIKIKAGIHKPMVLIIIEYMSAIDISVVYVSKMH